MRDRPFRPPQQKLDWPGGVVPEWAKPQGGKRRRQGKGGAGGSSGGGAKRDRLQKVMAQSGYGSRRNIEILIAQGHVTVNGQLAKLGDAVGPGDKVKLDGELLRLRFGEQLPRVLLYHKPEGEIVTRDDPEGRATVFERLPKVNGGRWVSVGRLDLNTGGLLLFTTNGELANRLMHPRFEVEREYAVRVMGQITDEQREKLLAGIDIEGDLCKFDSIEDRGGEGSNHWYHVVLREGKNREVRKMLEALALMVSRLMRVRYGPIALPGFLKRGMMREMNEDEVTELLAFAGVNKALPSEEDDAQPEGEPEARGEADDADEDEVNGNRGEPEALRAAPDFELEDDDRQPAFLAHAPLGQGHGQPRGQGQPRPAAGNAPGTGKKGRNRHGKKGAQGQHPGMRPPGQGKKVHGKNRQGQHGQAARGLGPRAPDRRVQHGPVVEERESMGIQAYVDGKMTHFLAPRRELEPIAPVNPPPARAPGQPRAPQGEGKPGGRNKRSRGRNRNRGAANAGTASQNGSAGNEGNAAPNDNRGNVGPKANRGANSNARFNDESGNSAANDNRGNVGPSGNGGGASGGGQKTDFDGNRDPN